MKKIAAFAEITRFACNKDAVEVEYEKNGHRGKLERIRFSTTEAGRPTKKIIECTEKGKTFFYDRNYEITVIAVFVNGHRHEAGELFG